jgi:hypothetical protein
MNSSISYEFEFTNCRTCLSNGKIVLRFKPHEDVYKKAYDAQLAFEKYCTERKINAHSSFNKMRFIFSEIDAPDGEEVSSIMIRYNELTRAFVGAYCTEVSNLANNDNYLVDKVYCTRRIEKFNPTPDDPTNAGERMFFDAVGIKFKNNCAYTGIKGFDDID